MSRQTPTAPLLVGLSGNQLGEWFSKCGPHITLELVRNENVRVLLLIYQAEILGVGLSHFTRLPKIEMLSKVREPLHLGKGRHAWLVMGISWENLEEGRFLGLVSGVQSVGSGLQPGTQLFNTLPRLFY